MNAFRILIFHGHQVHVQFLHMYFRILIHRFRKCFLYGGQWKFDRSKTEMHIIVHSKIHKRLENRGWNLQ